VIRPSVGLNATIAHSQVRPGNVALLAQSVGFTSAVLDWAQSNTFGFSLVAAPGAAVGVNFGDLLDYLSVDSKTRSVLVYLERIDDARAFLSGLRMAARVKPVIVLKSGRSGSAASGDMADADRVFDAAIARAGAVRVNTVHQLFTAARALMAGIRVKGPAAGHHEQRLRAGADGRGPRAAARREHRAALCGQPERNSHRTVPGARLVGRGGPARRRVADAYGRATTTLLADKRWMRCWCC
jgi:acetyltransferase